MKKIRFLEIMANDKKQCMTEKIQLLGFLARERFYLFSKFDYTMMFSNLIIFK